MVIMEHAVWLPREPGLHLDARVVHEPEIVDVDQLCHVHQSVDGEEEEREDEEAVVEYQLKGTHGNRRVGSGGVIPAKELWYFRAHRSAAHLWLTASGPVWAKK